MNSTQFALLAHQVTLLSVRQRQRILALLARTTNHDRTVEILETSAQPFLTCPVCRSVRRHKHGQNAGLQRFRCIDCGRTYNSLTGTPMARLRYKARWLEYTECLLRTTTVRGAAEHVHVHKNTTFRWRHRFLTLPKTDRPLSLSGIAEADEMYLLESEKGSRNLERAPRHRGSAATKRGISDEQVCILVARDRSGKTVDCVTGKGPVTKAQLQRCLLPLLGADSLLVTDANAAYRAFSKAENVSHEAVNLRAGVRVRGAVHVQNVNAYHKRFREWMERFHGVATHYLPSYLGWRWVLDAKRINSPESLLMATVGDFPHLTVT